MRTNATILRECCCAQCFGRLVEKFIDGQYRVVCPRSCKPGGFVSQRYADERVAESIAEAREVRRNYPALFPRSPEEVDLQARVKRALEEAEK